MTLRALTGLVLLAGAYAAVGLAVLWAIGVTPRRVLLVRYAGLAFLLGAGTTGVLWTILLVLGVPFTGWTILMLFLVEIVVPLAVGRRHGRARPTSGSAGRAFGYPAAVGILLTGVFLESLFAAARLQGLQSYDGWAFWVPKAKAIFLLHGLDEHWFTTLPGPSYPPLMPALNGIAFHAMGGIDVVSLHVHYWLIAVAFTWALVGLLWDAVPPWILWPFVLLVLVAPRVGDRLIAPQADIPLDAFLAVAVALVVLWLAESQDWQLWVAGAMLAAAVATKREGLLLAVCLVVATLVASADRPKQAARAGAFLVTGVIVGAVPWRIWVERMDIGGDGPAPGADRAGRAGPSLRLAAEVLFDAGLWSLVPTLTLCAVALGLLARRWRLVGFSATLLALAWLGGAWIVWLFPEIPLDANESTNPLVRYTLAPVAFGAVLTTVILADVWRTGSRPGAGEAS